MAPKHHFNRRPVRSLVMASHRDPDSADYLNLHLVASTVSKGPHYQALTIPYSSRLNALVGTKEALGHVPQQPTINRRGRFRHTSSPTRAGLEALANPPYSNRAASTGCSLLLSRVLSYAMSGLVASPDITEPTLSLLTGRHGRTGSAQLPTLLHQLLVLWSVWTSNLKKRD